MKLIYKTMLVPKTKFCFPSGICFNPIDHTFYVTELHNGCVRYFKREDSEAEFMTNKVRIGNTFALLHRPLGITWDRATGLWITDAGHDRVFHYNQHDSVWEDIISADRPSSPFHMVSGIAGDGEGNMYINDFLNRRILHFGPGRDYGEIDVSGGFDTAADKPYCIAFSKGNLFLADTDGNRIISYEAKSKKASVFPLSYPLWRPQVLVVNNKKYLFVFGIRKIYIFQWDGRSKLIVGADEIKLFSRSMSNGRLASIGAALSTMDNEIIIADTILGNIIAFYIEE